jgi:hypothetical protein
MSLVEMGFECRPGDTSTAERPTETTFRQLEATILAQIPSMRTRYGEKGSVAHRLRQRRADSDPKLRNLRSKTL